MSKLIIRITNLFFFFFMVLYLFVNALRLSKYWVSGTKKYILTILILSGVVFLFLLSGYIIKRLQPLVFSLERIKPYRLIIVLFIFVLATKLLMIFLLDTKLLNRGDMPTYFNFANQFATKGVITDESFYAYTYQYAAIFGWFLSPFVKLFGNEIKVVLVFMSLLYGVITIVLFDIIRPYAGNAKSFLGLTLFSIFPAGLFISQVIVHETALLFFYVLSFWLFLKARNNSLNKWIRTIAIIFSALLISFGACVNSGGIVVIISYIVISIIFLFKDKITKKKLIHFFTLFLCYLLCFFVVSKLCTFFVESHIVFPNSNEKQYAERVKENRLSFVSWPFYVGMNTESDGEFVKEDFHTYNKFYDMENEDEAKAYQMELISTRMKQFKEKPILVPIHLYYKFRKLYWNPFVAVDYFIETNLGSFLQSNSNGLFSKLFHSMCNAYNIIISSIILFSFKRHKVKRNKEVIVPKLQFKLFIVGLTLALLPFEMANKYVCHTQIIITCLAVLCLHGFSDNAVRIHYFVIERIKSRKGQ